MHTRFTTLGLAFSLLAWPLGAAGQSFEGVLKERVMEFDEYALFELTQAGADDEPDFDTEAAWFRYTAKRLFEVPLDRLAESGEGDVQEITLYIKGSKIRYGSTEGEGGSYMMMDLETMTSWIVMPGERSYVEISAEESEAAAQDAARRAEEMMAEMGIDPEALAEQAAQYEGEYGEDEMESGVSFKPKVESLGQAEEVNGMRAAPQMAEAGTEIGIGWCAEDVTGMRRAMERLAAQMDMEEEADLGGPSVQDLLCESELPVRTQVLRLDEMGGGLRYSVNEILSVERTAVSADMFEIPADYTKRSLADLWR